MYIGVVMSYSIFYCTCKLSIYINLQQIDFIGWGRESYFSACNYVVSDDFLFFLVLAIGCVFYCDNPWAFHMSI